MRGSPKTGARDSRAGQSRRADARLCCGLFQRRVVIINRHERAHKGIFFLSFRSKRVRQRAPSVSLSCGSGAHGQREALPTQQAPEGAETCRGAPPRRPLLVTAITRPPLRTRTRGRTHPRGARPVPARTMEVRFLSSRDREGHRFHRQRRLRWPGLPGALPGLANGPLSAGALPLPWPCALWREREVAAWSLGLESNRRGRGVPVLPRRWQL